MMERDDRPRRTERPESRRTPGSGQSRPSAARARQREAERKKAQAQRREAEARQRKRNRQRRASEAAKNNERRTPARPMPRRTLILKLVTTLAVLAALLLGLTIFFKVQVVRVSGNQKYTVQEIIDASGIEMGENLLTLGESRAAGRILAQYPYVGQVQIGIKLPNTVNIDIVELEAEYTIRDQDGTWWLINNDGKLLEPLEEEQAEGYTRVLGVQIRNPEANHTASAWEPEEEENADLGTASERLTAALEILTALQESDRAGTVTAVDLSGLYDIKVLYGEQYQVLFGGPSELTYKTRYMVQAVENLSSGEYRSGVLDLTFAEPGRAVFTPW